MMVTTRGLRGRRTAPPVATDLGDGPGLRSRSAGEPAPSAGVPSDATMAAVRRALQAHRIGSQVEERLTVAAAMAAAEARQQGLAAERMLVALKGAWPELAEVRQLDSSEARELSSRLVTLFIQAYYAPA